MRSSQALVVLAMRPLLAMALMAATVIIAAGPASAQCSSNVAAERAMVNATAVFVGEVISTSDGGRVAKVRVTSIWKGRDLPATVEVRGASEPGGPASATDRRFETGTTYLVIPENTREPFLATACSATQPSNAVSNVIPETYHQALGATEGRSPIGDSNSSETTETNFPILPILGSTVFVILGWLLFTRLRNGMPSRVESMKHERPVKKPKQRRFRKRSLAADQGRTGVGKRLVKKNRRTWRHRRRRQDRQLAASSSETASGSTDTS